MSRKRGQYKHQYSLTESPLQAVSMIFIEVVVVIIIIHFIYRHLSKVTLHQKTWLKYSINKHRKTEMWWG